MSLSIKTLPLGQLNTNCYLIWDEETHEALIIDPADNGTFISEQILELKLKPTHIILTHAHFDHILGLLEVKLNFDTPILMHQADQFLLESLPQRAKHWLQIDVPPAPPVDQFIKEGDTISFSGVNDAASETLFKVVETPGHTPGSIALYNHEIILTGDTLFKDSIGRYDFSYSNYKDLKNSLNKLFELPEQLVVYPGHGKQTTLKAEKNNLKNY